MKKSVEVVEVEVSAERLHLRELKREASRRCRARAKAISKGELLSPELALRSLQPKALKLDNFKMEVGDKSFRLNKNGGTAVVLIIMQRTAEGVTKVRKSFKDISLAIRAFNEAVKA